VRLGCLFEEQRYPDRDRQGALAGAIRIEQVLSPTSRYPSTAPQNGRTAVTRVDRRRRLLFANSFPGR
jgi:hypothetical protein